MGEAGSMKPSRSSGSTASVGSYERSRIGARSLTRLDGSAIAGANIEHSERGSSASAIGDIVRGLAGIYPATFAEARVSSRSRPISFTESHPLGRRSYGNQMWTRSSNGSTLPPAYSGRPSLNMVRNGTFADDRYIRRPRSGVVWPAEKGGVSGWEDGLGYGLNAGLVLRPGTSMEELDLDTDLEGMEGMANGRPHVRSRCMRN